MRILTFISFWLISLPFFSQEDWNMKMRQDFQLADFAFYQGNYVSALELLENIYANDSTYGPLLYEYGTSMIHLDKNKNQARQLLKRAVSAGEQEAHFWYAVSLHQMEEFNQAITEFETYLNVIDKEIPVEEVNRQIQICRNALKQYKKEVDVKVSNLGLGVNSPYKDYTPIITGDGKTIYFTSRRKNETFDKLDPNNEYFEDIYMAQKIDGQWSNIEMLGKEINTKSHEATVAISGDGNTMIIYRTRRNLTGGDLYLTEKLDGEWSKPEKLNDNINTPFQEASACLSDDGQVMYFSSTRPEGHGGKDLYIVRRLPTGDWSKAENLGPNINTKFDEDAPCINKEQTALYFSSNGHNTIGGYDIFKVNPEEEFWSTPENIGYPINTVDDEIYLTLDDTEVKGYYASDKGNGHGALDIYEIEFIYRKDRNLVAFGAVQNDQGTPIAASLTLFDKDTKKLQGIYKTHPETGKFMLAIHPKVQYQVLIESKDHQIMMTDLYIDDLAEGLMEYQIETYNLTTKK